MGDPTGFNPRFPLPNLPVSPLPIKGAQVPMVKEEIRVGMAPAPAGARRHAEPEKQEPSFEKPDGDEKVDPSEVLNPKKKKRPRKPGY